MDNLIGKYIVRVYNKGFNTGDCNSKGVLIGKIIGMNGDDLKVKGIFATWGNLNTIYTIGTDYPNSTTKILLTEDEATDEMVAWVI